jgi:hypothetical protein
MNTIYTDNGVYRLDPFLIEDELEEAIQKIKVELFGINRIYLNVKKKIGERGFQENIPDGYLIDLSAKTPRLYFVENELIGHDPLKHIAAQIVGFSVSFEYHPRKVREIIFKELHSKEEIKNICEQYILDHGYRNFDHFIDCMIADPFSAIIIIDEESSRLEAVLSKIKLNIDVIYVNRYRNYENNFFYLFRPFLQDVIVDCKGATQVKNLNPSELDTIVVPARDDGFQDVFINENRWYELRIESSMRDRVKYIACYRVSPRSAITHIAKIKSIEPWGDNGKWVINFEGNAEEIPAIVLNMDGRVKAPQSHRYALRERLLKATTLDDIWN